MLAKQVLQLRVTQVALCNKFRPTYVAVRVVAYINAQLVQQVFVASFCKWIKNDFVFHIDYILRRGRTLLVQ